MANSTTYSNQRPLKTWEIRRAFELAKKCIIPRDDIVAVQMSLRTLEGMMDYAERAGGYRSTLNPTICGRTIYVNDAIADGHIVTERRDGSFCLHSPEEQPVWH
jgi:hypothetical protein